MKHVFTILLLAFLPFQRSHGQAPTADVNYFLFANFSSKEAADPAKTVVLPPFEPIHVVDFSFPGATIKRVALEFSSDNIRWKRGSVLPVNGNGHLDDEWQSASGKLSPEEMDLIKNSVNLYVRISFFNDKGVYCGMLEQEGIIVQDVLTGRSYKAGKGIKTLARKKAENVKSLPDPDSPSLAGKTP